MSNYLKNKICLITGASSGIGLSTALSMAQQGAQVIAVGRNQERCQKVTKYIIKKTNNKKVVFVLCDLSSPKQIRQLVKNFVQKYQHLDVLVNNAGIYCKKDLAEQNCYQLTMMVNYLSPFLLTNLLLKNLGDQHPLRIINVTSLVHKNTQLALSDLNFKNKNLCNKEVYAKSKLALLIFTYELARRLKNTSITVNAMCPGGVATNIWHNSKDLKTQLFRLVMPLLKTPAQAASLVLYLAASSDLAKVSGKYFAIPTHLRFIPFDVKKTQTKSAAISYNKKLAKDLWQVSKKLVNLP